MQTQENHTNTQKRIIAAALNIISTDGFCKLTVRKVSSLAGVNVAAINYHFGSKEQLINQALHSITEQLKSCFEILAGEELLAEDRLGIFLDNYTKTVVKYPDIIKIFIMQSITEYEIRGEYEAFMLEEGYDLLKKTLRQIRPTESETIIGMRIMQMQGDMAFPILLGNRTIAQKDFDFFQEDSRSQYIELMMKCLTL